MESLIIILNPRPSMIESELTRIIESEAKEGMENFPDDGRVILLLWGGSPDGIGGNGSRGREGGLGGSISSFGFGLTNWSFTSFNICLIIIACVEIKLISTWKKLGT